MKDWLLTLLGRVAFKTKGALRGWRFPETAFRNHKYPRIDATPGTVIDLTYNGDVVARLVLDRVSRDLEGTTAVFVDYFHWQHNRRRNG